MNVKKIDLMHKMFGIGSEKCGTCNHLKTHSANRVWFKCEVYGDTSSEATDWRKSYLSCGLFNKPYNGRPIIEVKKHFSKTDGDEEQIEGQMSIFDLENNKGDGTWNTF